MSIGAGFGLAALIVALFGAFVLIVGLFVGWLALVLAALGALSGDRGFAIAATLVSGVVFIFLTPSLWADFAVGDQNVAGNGYLLTTISLVLLAAPLAGIALNASGRLALNKRAA